MAILHQDTVNTILDLLIKKFKEELRNQGHVSTGRLESSFEAKVLITGSGVIGYVYAEGYGLTLNTGLTPDQVIARGQDHLSGLIRYFQFKGLSGRELFRAAYSTWNAHKTVGIPTPGSFSFSRNGRRTGWIDVVLNENEEFVRKEIEVDAFNVLENDLGIESVKREPIKVYF